MAKERRVRAGSLYVFKPVGMDRYHKVATVAPGTVVRVIKMPGAPPPNTMGNAHIEEAESGRFAGMVLTNSLVPLSQASKRSKNMRFYSTNRGPRSRPTSRRRAPARRRNPSRRKRKQTPAQRRASLKNLKKARAAQRRRRPASRRRNAARPAARRKTVRRKATRRPAARRTSNRARSKASLVRAGKKAARGMRRNRFGQFVGKKRRSTAKRKTTKRRTPARKSTRRSKSKQTPAQRRASLRNLKKARAAQRRRR